MEPRLRDIIRALEKRERYDDAEYYRIMVPLQLEMLHGFSEKQVLNMMVDEIEGYFNMPPIPLKYAGWNKFYWGEAVDVVQDKRDS